MNNNRNNYSYAPTYGAQKKVPQQKKSANQQQAQPKPQPPITQQPYGYGQPNAAGQTPSMPPYFQPQPFGQQPFTPQGQQAQPQQSFQTQSNFQQPYQGAGYTPYQTQQPSAHQAGAPQDFYPPRDYYPQQTPFNTQQTNPAYASPQGAYTPSQPFQSGSYIAADPYATASIPVVPPSGSSTRQVPPAASAQRTQASDDGQIIERVLQGLLFFILPLLFVASLFVSLSIVKWAFIVLSALSLIVMWAKRSFLSSARLIVTLVYVALSAVTLVTVLTANSGDNTIPNTSGLTGGQPQLSQPNTQADPVQNNQGAGDGGDASGLAPGVNPADEEGVDPFPEDQQEEEAPALGASQTEQRLLAFLEAWVQNDRDQMLTLTSPKWRSEVSEAMPALFAVTGTKTVVGYQILAADGSDNDAIRNITVLISSTTPASSGAPKEYQYTVLMKKENGDWYVDPTSFKSYLATPTPTQPPAQDQNAEDQTQGAADGGIDPKLTLYYNPDGGSYYHAVDNCSTVDKKYYPLQGFYYEALNTDPYTKLKPCTKCNPPSR